MYVVFVTGFFCLASFQVSSVLWHVSVFHPVRVGGLFLSLLLYGYTRFCFSIHQLMNILAITNAVAMNAHVRVFL